MGWEPLPLEVAEWMGMDDDYLRADPQVPLVEAGDPLRSVGRETPGRR